MANAPRPHQLRQLIAQQAARMMAEEGISDYSYAKRKAARQLAANNVDCLPTNSEIENELKLYHEIYGAEDHPQHLHSLRTDALKVMQLLEAFNPYLVGSVLDGTAGRFAETNLHLFADSLKDVELFLLNQDIPYEMAEKSYRFGGDRRRTPVFELEGPNGLIRLSVFSVDDLRTAPKSMLDDGSMQRASMQALTQLIKSTEENLGMDL